MVHTTKKELPKHKNGSLDTETWLQKILENRDSKGQALIRQAIILARLTSEEQITPYGESALTEGLVMGETLNDLLADSTTIAAAIIYPSAQFANLRTEDIADNVGANVAKLINSTKQLANISKLYKSVATREQYQQNLDNIRKMLLAMVDDIRIVLIKLAEQLYILRRAASFEKDERQQIAQEISAIYAPLANRLGMIHMKWELEDLSFRYLEPEKYNEISSSLHQTKLERDQYIEETIAALTAVLEKVDVTNFQISGRAKHIYSIYRKMTRKKVGIADIYDASAFRILVPSLEDCYKALSAVHATWEHIAKEFDDYIANPKPNGYRSIHTAVVGPQGKNVEIQIRTYDMHQHSELGVAAHWIYKEGATPKSSYEAKIAWLRQIMAWQSEITADEHAVKDIKQIFSDRIYVFTPQGDILDLPSGATPLDFAYHVHSEIGNLCVGAKVNGNIVPLNQLLNTGEYIEILTSKNAKPSRDWLNPDLGYLKSPRARAKVLSWFKKQSMQANITQGQALLDKELRRLGLKQIDFDMLLKKLHHKNKNELFASLGSGETKISTLLNLLAPKIEKPEMPPVITEKPVKHVEKISDLTIQGVDNLLISIANCCKPIPYEKIVGYITRGHGVSIHREDCANMLYASKMRPERIIFVTWGEKIKHHYPVTIKIKAFDRSGLMRDISNVIADEDMTMSSLHVTTNKKDNLVDADMTIEITDLNTLSKILNKISHVSGVLEVSQRSKIKK